MKRYLNKIHYAGSKKIPDKMLETLLILPALGYSAGVSLRSYLYKLGLIEQVKLPAYVISIGNLTTGGTGKTPLTAEIARYIKAKTAKNIAILSHGYGGKLPVNKVNIVSDGKNIYHSPELAGDEPYWMAGNLKNVWVLTSRNRSKAGNYAINKFKTDILILDDGFQHIKLKRDLNILVIDSIKKFGNNQLLPAGPLREPLSQIKRADKIVVVNKQPYNMDQDIVGFIENLKEKFNKPVFICNVINGDIYNIANSEILSNPCKAYAFAGIAQPEFFFNNLKEKKCDLVGTKEFTDHHMYTENDILSVQQEAISHGAECLITTEKDAVKLLEVTNNIELKIPIFALKLKLDIDLDGLLGAETDLINND